MFKVAWYKNGLPVILSQRHTVSFDEHNSVIALKIKNATPDDSGVYTVRIQNPLGSDSSDCQVRVSPAFAPKRVEDHLNPAYQVMVTEEVAVTEVQVPVRAPRIMKAIQHDVNIKEGEPFQLTCIVDGYPEPKVNWFKNNQPLIASERIRTYFNPANGHVSLSVKESNLNDTGVYKVIAENPAGEAETQGLVTVAKSPDVLKEPIIDPTAFRYIEHPPVQEQPIQREQPQETQAPRFLVNLPAKCKVQEGEPIKLACQVQGKPEPSVIRAFKQYFRK